MKKKILAFFSLICIIHSSCSDKKYYPVTEIIPTKQVEKVNESIQIVEGCYSDCFILDSLLILIANCDSNYFHVYDKRTLSLILKFGIKGEGPNDFSRPTVYNSTLTKLEQNGIISFYDIHLGYNKDVNFGEILQGKSLTNNILAQPMSKDLLPCYEINFISKDKIVMRSVDEEKGLFMFYNPLKEEKKWVKHHPKMKGAEGKRHVYYGLVHSNPSKKSIVYSSRYFDEILFFDLEGNLNKEYYFSEMKLPPMSDKFSGVSNEATIYSARIYSTLEHCYILRANQPFNKLINDPILPVHMLKLDWSGNMVDIIQLSTFPYLYCVDEETGILYLINRNNKEDEFYSEILTFSL